VDSNRQCFFCKHSLLEEDVDRAIYVSILLGHGWKHYFFCTQCFNFYVGNDGLKTIRENWQYADTDVKCGICEAEHHASQMIWIRYESRLLKECFCIKCFREHTTSEFQSKF
jgi:hypothetical protein